MDFLTPSSEDPALIEFWEKNLAGYRPPSLPASLPSAKKHFQKISFEFSTSESQSMCEFSRQYNSNLFCFFYLSLAQAFYESFDLLDLGITTMLHQDNKLSALFIRHKLNPKLSLIEELSQVSLSVFKTYEHRNSNLEKLLNRLELNPPDLFHTLLSVVDENRRNLVYLPCKEACTLPFPIFQEKAKFIFSLQQTQENIRGEFQFDSAFYSPDSAKALLEKFQQIARENLKYFKR